MLYLRCNEELCIMAFCSDAVYCQIYGFQVYSNFIDFPLVIVASLGALSGTRHACRQQGRAEELRQTIGFLISYLINSYSSLPVPSHTPGYPVQGARV